MNERIQWFFNEKGKVNQGYLLVYQHEDAVGPVVSWDRETGILVFIDEEGLVAVSDEELIDSNFKSFVEFDWNTSG